MMYMYMHNCKYEDDCCWFLWKFMFIIMIVDALFFYHDDDNLHSESITMIVTDDDNMNDHVITDDNHDDHRSVSRHQLPRDSSRCLLASPRLIRIHFGLLAYCLDFCVHVRWHHFWENCKQQTGVEHGLPGAIQYMTVYAYEWRTKNYLLLAMDMAKVVVPYRLWRFSHKFEHPKSTPDYFSVQLILSVTPMYMHVYMYYIYIDIYIYM